MQAVLDNLDIFLRAFSSTLQLTGLAAVGALILGILIAAMRVSPAAPLRGVGATYIRLVRNTPLTIVFFMVSFGLPELGIGFPYFTFAVIALTLYTASFVAEAVRSGVNAVPVGQAEAARSVGLTFPQTLGTVVLPQAIRTVVPPLASIFIALLKNTSVASAFGVTEAMGGMRGLISGQASDALWFFVATAFGYVVLTLFFGRIFGWLEGKAAIAR